MLQLAGTILGKDILSLRTGGPVARIVGPIINPNNLKIEGFYCEDSIDKQELFLLFQDIRDVLPQGIVINDYEVLASRDELIRLKDILDLKFELIGKPVETVNKEKVGKVTDYAIEASSMYVQKLYVSQSLIKNLTSGSLSIDRSAVQEITPRRIIITELLHGVPAGAVATA